MDPRRKGQHDRLCKTIKIVPQTFKRGERGIWQRNAGQLQRTYDLGCSTSKQGRTDYFVQSFFVVNGFSVQLLWCNLTIESFLSQLIKRISTTFVFFFFLSLYLFDYTENPDPRRKFISSNTLYVMLIFFIRNW